MENSATLSGSLGAILTYGTYFFIGLAIVIFLIYEIRVFLTKDLKDRYDFVNLHEIRYFWMACMSLVLAAAMFANVTLTKLMAVEGESQTYIRIFFTAAFIAIAYYVVHSLIRIYYPGVVEKRLKKIRNKPRLSPDGNPMRKLTEAEENVHLEKFQIDQEASDVHSVDYDVWIDDKTGFKKIEKYMVYQHVEKCSECGFHTLKLSEEEIKRPPGQDHKGILLEHYICSYCRHREAKEIAIAELSTNTA